MHKNFKCQLERWGKGKKEGGNPAETLTQKQSEQEQEKAHVTNAIKLVNKKRKEHRRKSTQTKKLIQGFNTRANRYLHRQNSTATISFSTLATKSTIGALDVFLCFARKRPF